MWDLQIKHGREKLWFSWQKPDTRCSLAPTWNNLNFYTLRKHFGPANHQIDTLDGCVALRRFIYSPFDLFLFLPVEEGWDSYTQAGDPLIRSVPLCLGLSPVILLKKPSFKSVRLLGGQTIALPPQGSFWGTHWESKFHWHCMCLLSPQKGVQWKPRRERRRRRPRVSGTSGEWLRPGGDNGSRPLVCSHFKEP